MRLKILSWNVNGLRSIAGKGFLEWLFSESPDILCLQETKAHPDQLDPSLLKPQGYLTFWNNPPRKGYAGVSVFSKIKPVSVEKDFPPSSFDTEGRALILDFKDFILINVYFPNGGMGPERLKYKLDFYEKFLEFIDGIKNRNLVICGDVNTAHKEIDLARPEQNEMISGFLPEERVWIDKLIDHGYVDTFRRFNRDSGQYTWWDYKSRSRERNVGWRIDCFFVTRQLMPAVKGSFIMTDVMGSDHCPVGVLLEK